MGKRILFVGLAYYPNVGFGGPVRVMRSYGLALVSRGHDVTIYCSNIVDREFRRLAPRTLEVEREGLHVVYLKTEVRLSDGFTISLDLLRYLHKNMGRFDVVHLFGARDFFTGAAASFARWHRRPYLVHPLGTITYNNSKVLLKRSWDWVIGRRLIGGAAYVVEPTQGLVADVLAFGVAPEKVGIVPWSPDPSLQRFPAVRGEFRRQFGLGVNKRVILYLGRVHRKKRLDLVISSLAWLGDLDPQLIVVGHDDDGSMGGLKELADRMGLGAAVKWAGPIHSPESAAAYADADVFVLMSENESAPMALLEALSMGVPVVISENTGMSEMVRDRAGLVVPLNAKEVATALRRILVDDTLRSRFGAGGRELAAEEFAADGIGRKLENLYATLGC